MKQNIELDAAEMLLDTGVSLPLMVIVPFKKKPVVFARLTMKRPFLGSQMRIARLFLQMNVTWEEIEAFSREQEYAFIAKNGKALSIMIALTILRGPVSGLFAPLLAWVLRWCVPPVMLLGANLQYTSLLGIKPFTTIIRSTQRINPMTPRLSRKKKGS